jgi:hypothetical protein
VNRPSETDLDDSAPDGPFGDLRGAPADLSPEVTRELQRWIETGEVECDRNSSRYFRVLEQYPIGVNRIDWSAVREPRVLDVLPCDRDLTTGAEHEARLLECRETLLHWFAAAGIAGPLRVVWVGDGCDTALRMNVDTLLQLYPSLFSWPQNHYVLPESGAWCLNYSIEGQLFWGRSHDALRRGCRDSRRT